MKDKPYGVRTRWFDRRSDRLTVTEKYFTTEAERERYLQTAAEQPLYYGVDAYLDPQ